MAEEKLINVIENGLTLTDNILDNILLFAFNKTIYIQLNDHL